jgi:glycosyltransferase involved in cell wall biosynthesis
VIHSEHGYELDMLAGLPLRRKYARRIAYAMADLVFAVTHNLRDFHARQVGLPPERFRVIYNGVDTQRFAPRPKERAFLRHKLGLSEGCFVVGTVGRMVPIKDHGTLIKAAGMLSRRGLNTHLLLVGSGPEIEQHRQTVQGTPELTGRVSFLGASDNIPEPLNAMDAFVLPSIAEGMSNTLLEAMATGLPIVATRVGGNPELVEEGTSGQLFSPGDVADLADRLGALARSSETRLRLGAAARRRVLAHFTLEQMVANYRKMYRELADQRRIPRGSEV